MNRRRLLFSLGSLPALAEAADEGWRPIFDGRTLQGWEPSAKSPHSRISRNQSAGNWRVEGGAIVGDQHPAGNGGLLLTTEVFGDVEVSLETNNDFGPDSGLFLRCTKDGRAYQCLIDYHKGGTVGGILGEGIWKRRGVRNYTFGDSPDVISLNDNDAHPCPVKPEAWKSFWRIGGWNEVRARITGDPPTITTWVNGVQIMQHTETASMHPPLGHIGLQLHGGPQFAGTVRYRNLRIRKP